MKTVFVVTWEVLGSCGGFDWFYEQSAASKAFENERAHLDGPLHSCAIMALDVSSHEAATDELDDVIWSKDLHDNHPSKVSGN